jgi:glycosyltransferase involved in cell wall biosynthesis
MGAINNAKPTEVTSKKKKPIFVFMGGHNFWEGLYDTVNIAFILNLLNAGLIHSYDLLMTTVVDEGLPEDKLNILEQKENALRKKLEENGIRIAFYQIPGRTIRGIKQASEEIKKIISPYQHRFIWAQNYFNGYIGQILKKSIHETDLHFDMRGLVPQEEFFYSSSNLLSRIAKFFVLQFIEKTNLDHADSITVVSKRFLDYIHGKYRRNSKPSYLLPNYFDEQRFFVDPLVREIYRDKYKIKKDQTLILYSGMLQKWQDPDLLFAFIKHLQKQDQDGLYRFIILTYDQEKALHFSDKYKIKDLIIDDADGDALNGIYNAADIGLAFRDDNIASVVSCPVKIPEYLAAGNSIILLESIGDFGHDLAGKKFVLVKKNKKELLQITLSEINHLEKPNQNDQAEILEKYSSSNNITILREIIKVR